MSKTVGHVSSRGPRAKLRQQAPAPHPQVPQRRHVLRHLPFQVFHPVIEIHHGRALQTASFSGDSCSEACLKTQLIALDTMRSTLHAIAQQQLACCRML
jgi:hypothetical protein